jgi:hypothetical protein
MAPARCLIVCLVLLAVAFGCGAPPPAQTVRPFGDNRFFISIEGLEWAIGSTIERIVVPAGFVTDFASIPQSLWSLGLSAHGQYSRAALIHD